MCMGQARQRCLLALDSREEVCLVVVFLSLISRSVAQVCRHSMLPQKPPAKLTRLLTVGALFVGFLRAEKKEKNSYFGRRRQQSVSCVLPVFASVWLVPSVLPPSSLQLSGFMIVHRVSRAGSVLCSVRLHSFSRVSLSLFFFCLLLLPSSP
jgi:hypothetical protein